MNIKEFMQNPTGKGATIPGKYALLEDLDRKYGNLISNKKIVVNCYHIKEDYIIHLLIPTEADRRTNTYDVVIQFTPSSQADLIDGTLKNYTMRYFSNCPSFTFTYAYVAGIDNNLVSDLRNKFNAQILGTPPVSRNPGLIMSYEKTIYYACKHLMKSNQYLYKDYLNVYSKPWTRKVWDGIRTYSQIDEEIRKSKAIDRQEKMQAGNKKVAEKKNQTTDVERKETITKQRPIKKQGNKKKITAKPKVSSTKRR